MWIHRISSAAMIAFTLICLGSSAGGPQLSKTAINEDTFAVIILDVTKFDIASLDGAVDAIFGATAAMVKDGLKDDKTYLGGTWADSTGDARRRLCVHNGGPRSF